MRCTWDENKRRINTEKHGTDFMLVHDFDWDEALMGSSTSSNEPRLVAIAPIGQRLYVLVYSIETAIVRVISLRKANKREVKLYETQA